MSLASGSRLGPYEIVSPLGTGGMGEVYRARDTKLNRDVAVKVLPPAFAQDSERMARFQREAQVLAALNHPNIAQIYGMEENALVMELVPGDMLQGPLPVDEVLAIARQIAEALEAAHEKGIVHRDLKPANIKVTPDGKVKVLDFGLAKALEETANDISHSPTMSLMATRAGVILGTAAYMSPEQAKGKSVDRRTDIWSFGVVLLELITGQRAFAGDNASEVLAGVILRDVVIPAGLPSHLDRLLRRCLMKDPRQRLQAIGEARIMLESPAEVAAPPEVALPAAPALPRRSREPLWIAIAVAGVIATVALWAPWRAAPKLPPVRRIAIRLGSDAPMTFPNAPMTPSLALSPDGTILAFVGGKSTPDKSLIYLRRLDQLKTTPLAGTEGAATPFFSPDNQWIAFFATGKLKKISVNGGSAIALCDAPNAVGGSWSEDGTIFFAPTRTSVLMRVSAAGGSPAAFSTIAAGGRENAHRWPQALPGGKAVLYNAGTALNFDQSDIVVRVIATGETKIVQRGGYFGRYLPNGSSEAGAFCRDCGYLIFMHDGTMFAAPFDIDRLETTAQPVPVIEEITSQPSSGATQIAFSNDGTLIYLAGVSVVGPSSQNTLSWMDRAGKTEPLRNEPSPYLAFRFSPDGRSLATTIYEARGSNLWVYQWERGTMSRLTHDATLSGDMAWTPDGRRIAYVVESNGSNIYWRLANGAGEAQRLTESSNADSLGSWHPSGKFLAFRRNGTLMILPMEGNEASGWRPGKPYPFDPNTAQFVLTTPAFSPDGRWLTYTSNESGNNEVYVKPFPGPGGKWQISTNGGLAPAWSKTGKDLFYLTPQPGKIMAVGYSASGDAFQAGKPRPWSESQPTGMLRFDPHPDGKRMAIGRAPGTAGETSMDHLVLIENFFDELRRVAPGKK
jgi:serine/threonine-protein kinase